MTLFTVQLELGPETRAMVERLALDATMHFEFGPETRKTLKNLFPKEASKQGRRRGPPAQGCGRVTEEVRHFYGDPLQRPVRKARVLTITGSSRLSKRPSRTSGSWAKPVRAAGAFG